MKILSLDIETYPHLVTTWGLYDQNIGLNQIIKPGYVLCFAAKWKDKDEIIFRSVHEHGQVDMLNTAHALIEEADAVMGYNSQRFDIPTLSKEFLCLGLTPPSPIKHIDLLKTVKKQFRFPSNKLDFVSQALGLGEKVKHEGHELWLKCGEGDAEAWKKMEAYNINDVILVENLYNRLLPWIPNHPNRALYEYTGEPSCPKCNSTDLERRGYAFTPSGRYARVCCRECGSWSRVRTSDMDKDEKATILVST